MPVPHKVAELGHMLLNTNRKSHMVSQTEQLDLTLNNLKCQMSMSF